VIRNIRTALSALALAAVLLLPGTALAEEAADRAVVVAEEITLTGKVVAIGKESRMIIVEGPKGRQVAMKAPKEGQNFDQISMGDTVTARYFESVALAITPVADAQPGASELTAVSLAPPGATPGGTIVDQIQLRAVVAAVDAEARKVTLDVPAGGQRILKVREGVDLARVKVGEEVGVTLTEALAITIAPSE
jgi:hypothetical protein